MVVLVVFCEDHMRILDMDKMREHPDFRANSCVTPYDSLYNFYMELYREFNDFSNVA